MTVQLEPLLPGEKAVKNAPKAELADGRHCIPQHYLSYQHSLASVEALVLDIEFDPRYPIFASQDSGGIYIQVGVIGYDNYQATALQNKAKLVYGRKWRVEPKLPTSEIIQTIFLALKKAREHEVRELFRLQLQDMITTPFNGHHDLPLLTTCRDQLQAPLSPKSVEPGIDVDLLNKQRALEAVLHTISYAGASFEVSNLLQIPSGYWLVELALQVGKGTSVALAELSEKSRLHFVVEQVDSTEVLQQLMQQLIQLSDRFVDEYFYYRGFNRFSWKHNVEAIAQLSCDVRQLHKQTQAQKFTEYWQKSNYETDLSRIPTLEPGPLWLKIKAQLAEFSPVESTLPMTRMVSQS